LTCPRSKISQKSLYSKLSEATGIVLLFGQIKPKWHRSVQNGGTFGHFKEEEKMGKNGDLIHFLALGHRKNEFLVHNVMNILPDWRTKILQRFI